MSKLIANSSAMKEIAVARTLVEILYEGGDSFELWDEKVAKGWDAPYREYARKLIAAYEQPAASDD